MGDIGFGNVEVFVAKDKAFKTACIKSWDQQNSPKLMCELLGYKWVYMFLIFYFRIMVKGTVFWILSLIFYYKMY